MDKFLSMETPRPVAEQEPRVRLMITRHAERLPSGELSPEGLDSSRGKGESIKGSAEVIKGYSSDEKSNRTYDTSEAISNASKIVSPLTEKTYSTRKVADIQYKILKPDLASHMAKAKEVIEEATLKELGLSIEKDENGKFKINIEKLPKEEQHKIAPIRQKNQRLGMEYILSIPEASRRMAMGLAHQLMHEAKILDRYQSYREKKIRGPKMMLSPIP